MGLNWCCQLLWVVLIGLIFALVIQSLAANLGVCTGNIKKTYKKKKVKESNPDFIGFVCFQGNIFQSYAGPSTRNMLCIVYGC